MMSTGEQKELYKEPKICQNKQTKRVISSNLEKHNKNSSFTSAQLSNAAHNLSLKILKVIDELKLKITWGLWAWLKW
jgi:hypothetical protein